MRKMFIMTALLLLSAACATTNHGGSVSGPSSREDIVKRQHADELAEKLSNANVLFRQGDVRSAALLYQALLREYRSDTGDFECAVRTNLALAHIEEGNRQAFKTAAGRLAQDCRRLDYLSQETQFVFSLDQMLDESSSHQPSDARIETRVSRTMGDLLKGGTK